MIQKTLNIIDQYFEKEIRTFLSEVYIEVKREVDKTALKEREDHVDLLNRSEAAKYLKISLSTLDKLTRYDHLPFYKLGDSVKYAKNELNNFLKLKRNVY